VSQPFSISPLGKLLARPGTTVVAAFLIRAGWFYWTKSHGPYPVVELPSFGYETGRIAGSLASGKGFSSPLHLPTGPTAWITPLFPLLLAGIFRITGIFSWTSLLVAGMVDCAFSAFAAWPLWAVARKAFGEATGITAGWLWAALPLAVYYPVFWIWDTSLTALMFTLVLAATMRLKDTESSTAWTGYGALLGITALVNAAVVSTYPFFLAWAALRVRKRAGNWMRLAGLACVACALVMSPWWIRNYATFHRFIPFRSNFGFELWLGNNPHQPDIWTWWLHPDEDAGVMAEFQRLGEIRFMDAKEKEALEWIRTHPGDFVRNSFDRVSDTWLAFDEPVWQVRLMHTKMQWLYLLSTIYSAVTFAGAFLAARRRNEYAALFGTALVVFPAIYYVTHSSLRYRYPIEPVMALMTAYALVSLVSAIRHWGAESNSARAARVAGEMTPSA
jgi:hypothetical protein